MNSIYLIIMDMQSANIKLSNIIDFLQAEKYEIKANEGKDTDPYCVILIYDSESVPDAVYYRDYGYGLRYFQTLQEAMSWVGIIFCGGMYTSVGLFRNQDNITKQYIINMDHFIPRGGEPSGDDICVGQLKVLNAQDSEIRINSGLWRTGTNLGKFQY